VSTRCKGIEIRISSLHLNWNIKGNSRDLLFERGGTLTLILLTLFSNGSVNHNFVREKKPLLLGGIEKGHGQD
jgi:hypothetical protein